MTKERKVLGAVLAVALLGLVINAFIPGGGVAGPVQAKAASERTGKSTAKTLDVAVSKKVLAQLANDEPGDGGLASRLAKFAKDDRATASNRDAFVPSKQWLTAAGMTGARASKESTGIRAFVSRHHLMAVMAAGAGGGANLAVVDDQSLRVGDSLDGFRLMKLNRRSAVFAGPAGRVVLSLSTGQ